MANLDPVTGSEQAGMRPVAVVSREIINRNSPVVLVVPFTDAANKKRIYPSQVKLPLGSGGLVLDSVALCEQVRAIATSRMGRLIGRLNTSQLASIEAALRIALDLP
jgi:mRNA interferase MazF